MIRVSPFGLVCARCGQYVSWSQRHLRYVHSSHGPVAACDLDSEHTAQPDWAALGPVACVECDAPAHSAGAEFSHVDTRHDRTHRADPGFPGLPTSSEPGDA